MYNLLFCTVLLVINSLEAFQSVRFVYTQSSAPGSSKKGTTIVNSKKEPSSSIAPPDDGLSEQYAEWEEEEKERLIWELKEEASKDPENEGTNGKLPDYMLRMIEQFEDNQIVVVEEELEAEKLPSIAVIGR